MAHLGNFCKNFLSELFLGFIEKWEEENNVENVESGGLFHELCRKGLENFLGWESK